MAVAWLCLLLLFLAVDLLSLSIQSIHLFNPCALLLTNPVLPQEHLPTIRDRCDLKEDAVIHLPRSGQRADAYRAGLAACQVSPYAWRILVSMCVLNDDHDLSLTLADLAHMYLYRPLGPVQMTLQTVDGRVPSILMPTKVKDGGWFKFFIYVRLDSIVPQPFYLLDKWSPLEGFKQHKPSLDDSAVRKLLGLSEDQRKFPRLLSSNFGGAVEEPPEAAEEDSASVEEIGEFESAAEVRMSSAVSQFMAKKKRKLTGGDVPSAPRKKKAAAPPSEEEAISGDVPLWPLMGQFLLPGSQYSLSSTPIPATLDSTVEDAFKTFQKAFFLRHDHVRMIREVNNAQEKCVSLEAQLVKAQAEVKVLEDQLARMQRLNRSLSTSMKGAEDKLKISEGQSSSPGNMSRGTWRRSKRRLLSFPTKPDMSFLNEVDNSEEEEEMEAAPVEEEVEAALVEEEATTGPEQIPVNAEPESGASGSNDGGNGVGGGQEAKT
ncbi:hypothetical protein KSS87_001579 [Heliosperma pusillum]|nr:hypothetical protein KSS87_001579 [Heliosperma pusillum]